MYKFVVRTQNNHIVLEGQKSKLYNVFPKLEGVSENNMIEINCNKLDEHRVLSCVQFIISCGYDFTDIKFDKFTYVSIKKKLDESEDKILAYDMLVILEYFKGNVMDEMIAFLYYMCMMKRITIRDEVVLTYVRNKVKSIWIDKRYEKSVVHNLCRKYIIYKVVKNNIHLKERLKYGYNRMIQCNREGTIGLKYYPKDKRSNIEYIYGLDENGEYMDITYKHEYKEGLINNTTYSIIDENKRWIYNKRREIVLDGMSRVKGYKLHVPVDRKIEIEYGMIVYKKYEKSILKSISIIPGNIIYRYLFCPTIEEVCEIFVQMMLDR